MRFKVLKALFFTLPAQHHCGRDSEHVRVYVCEGSVCKSGCEHFGLSVFVLSITFEYMSIVASLGFRLVAVLVVCYYEMKIIVYIFLISLCYWTQGLALDNLNN